MKIDYFCVSHFPKLSWLADINFRNATTVVYHGYGLEVHPNFFIEGTWNGDFTKGGFDQTECMFGTGAILKGDSIIFVSSAATTDGLFYRQVSSHFIVSNSLPFILAYTEDSLDPQYQKYHIHNESILYGIKNYERTIQTKHGIIGHLFFRNLLVNAHGFMDLDKPMPPRFKSYNDYYDYLLSNYKLIVNNIRAQDRVNKLDICSTQSRGYDTTAVNAIASLFGIDQIFTCTKAKGIGAYADSDGHLQQNDDGSDICKSLGLKCISIDRKAYEKDFTHEYLFYSSQHSNQDANFLDIANYMKRVSILLTGTLGELWYTTQCAREGQYYIDSGLKRWDLGCHGLTEFRLQVGFIQLPLPYMGAQRRVDIQEITDSLEMAPWRLNNHYDRPIPRRIAEERGVPRDLFGQTKLAAVVEFTPPRIPQNAQLRNEYFSFLIENGIAGRPKIALFPLIQVINTMITFKFTKKYRIIYFVERLISTIIGREYSFPLLWKDLNSSLFCFCVNKRVNDYTGPF